MQSPIVHKPDESEHHHVHISGKGLLLTLKMQSKRLILVFSSFSASCPHAKVKPPIEHKPDEKYGQDVEVGSMYAHV